MNDHKLKEKAARCLLCAMISGAGQLKCCILFIVLLCIEIAEVFFCFVGFVGMAVVAEVLFL